MLRDELIPIIEGRYRADPQRRVLVGQSRGASFVLHSALTEPDLFGAASPATPPAQSATRFGANRCPQRGATCGCSSPAGRAIVRICVLARLSGTRTGSRAKSRGRTISSQ
ncbi:MAG: hypothetical protein IPG56_11235 [Caulobacteraceae bacterium]|nr:hypothetical protein [Caulobacteraceae bacterium]